MENGIASPLRQSRFPSIIVCFNRIITALLSFFTQFEAEGELLLIKELLWGSTTQNFISFAYIAIPLICLAVMAIIMIFLNVENHLPMVHEKLTAKRKAEAEARGEVYVSPAEKAALEEAQQAKEAEEKRIEELKAKCARKGLSFAEEEAKYQAALKAKQDKANAKKKK